MDKKKLKILILSCNTGEGHNMAARAICEQCKAEGHEAEVVDYLAIHSRFTSWFISGFYIGLAKYFPHVFGFFYNGMGFLSRKVHVGRSSVYWLNALAAPRLRKFLEKGNYDAVVCSHMFAAECLTRLKRRGKQVPPSIMVSTDYTCYPHLEEVESDLFVLAHEDLLPDFEKRGFDPAVLRPCGIPIGMRFQGLPSRAEAREQLGLSNDAHVYLVMGGSMGAGHIRSFTKRLSSELQNGKIFVICGKNKRLKKSLERHVGRTHHNVVILGFTKEIPTYMAACDVLYTKPGGLTSTEAIVCHTPMISTKPIPGCETDNRDFFLSHGVADYAKTVEQKVESGRRLAENAREQARMKEAQEAFAKPNAALNIVRLIEEELCKE